MTERKSVATMFDQVAPWYDAMNERMSLGLHRVWRRRTAAALPAGGRVLDLATGTADLAIALARRGCTVVGVDLSAGMLALGRRKVGQAGLAQAITLLQGDVLALALPAGSFDAASNAFLLRNLADMRPALAEMARVVRPGGRLACLEIAYPQFAPWRALFRLYFDHIVPWLGRRLTGAGPAYRYLPASLERFPPPAEVLAALADTGWAAGRPCRLFPGTVVLYTAVRAAS
jgi:demethylmenaquinone methyltransferase/2-methoxy-6-polyprenyl-1,4-benzoquinol methylase